MIKIFASFSFLYLIVRVGRNGRLHDHLWQVAHGDIPKRANIHLELGDGKDRAVSPCLAPKGHHE